MTPRILFVLTLVLVGCHKNETIPGVASPVENSNKIYTVDEPNLAPQQVSEAVDKVEAAPQSVTIPNHAEDKKFDLYEDVERFRIDCGAPDEEQARQGSQAVALTVMGKPDLTNVLTELTPEHYVAYREALQNGEQGEQNLPWYLNVDVHLDQDAKHLDVIRNEAGKINGYRIQDKVKKNSNGWYRMIEITEISECIELRGGIASGSKATLFKVNADGTITAPGIVMAGCTCEFESKEEVIDPAQISGANESTDGVSK